MQKRSSNRLCTLRPPLSQAALTIGKRLRRILRGELASAATRGGRGIFTVCH